MTEKVPREYLAKVLELSRQMVSLAGIDPGYEMDSGCRAVFGALFDYGYALKKMAEEELAAHEAADTPLAEESSLDAPLSTPSDPRTALIVADDRDFLNYLSLLFQGSRFETLVAPDALEAMEWTRTRRPDLVVLDVSMQAEPGTRVYRDLTADPALEEIPVVLVTDDGDSPRHLERERSRAAGPVHFVSKPVDVDLLWKAVRAVLRGPSE